MHSAFALASPWLASKRTLPRFGTTFRRSFLLPSVAPSPKTAPCLPRARTTMSSAGDKKHLTAMDDVKAGAFVRKESAFRSVITNDGSTPFAPVAGRYRLYVSLACPWASRCLMTLSLLGLDEPSVLPVTVVHHFMGDRGWAFVEEGDPDIPPRCEPEPLFGFKNVRDLYFKADPSYSGRFTVPLLWDTELNTIVNNESAEIIVMLNNAFTSLAKTARDLYPENIREEIDAVSESFYAGFNNGVYRCGFATSQAAYDAAYEELWATASILEEHLSTKRYLCGSQLTLADVRLFPTLIRFDAVYTLHFKCSETIREKCPNLLGYTRELYQMPEIRKTVDFEHIKQHYYRSHPSINPHRIVPGGPDLAFLDEPHGRDAL